MEYIAIFYNHAGAIKFSRIIDENKIKGQLIPAPRKLSSNCNVACKFYINDQDMSSLIFNEVEKIFKIENKNFSLIYEDEL